MEEKKIIFEFEVNNKDANAKLEEIAKAIDANATAQKNLANAYANGSKSQEEYAKEQKVLVGEQRALNGTLRDLEKGTKEYSQTLQGQRNKLADLKKEWANTNLATAEGKKRFDELSTEIGELNGKILDQEKAVGTFTRQVGNYPKAFDAMKTSIDGATGGFLSMAKAILTNPIGAVITGIVAAFALLNKAIQSNDETATLFKGVVAGIGIIVDKFFNTIAEGIEYLVEWNNETGALSTAFDILSKALIVSFNSAKLLVNLFTGDFKGAANTLVDTFNTVSGSGTSAFDNITESMKASIQAGIEYEAQLDAIEAAQSEFEIREANILRLRNKALIQSKDLTKSEQERNALLEEAEFLNLTLLNQRLELIDKQIAAEQEYIKNFKGSSSERETIQFRLNSLLADRINLESEFDTFNEKAINKQNALIEKQQALAEKKREADRKAAEEKQKQIEKEQAEEEKLQAQREAAIEKDYQATLDILNRNLKARQEIKEFEIQQDIDAQKEIIANTETTEGRRIEAIRQAAFLEQELETEKREWLLENQNLTSQERELLVKQSNQRLVEIEREKVQQETDIDKKAKEEKNQALQTSIGYQEQLLAGFFQTALTLSEGDKEAQRAIALTQAAINTALAVTKALSTLPPPASFITAAATAATGAAQIATISAAAGGGDFVTTKPTLLLVGDNPGARERVTVTPLSGKGKTTVSPSSGLIAMAGGGSITTGSANASSQIDSEVMQSRMLMQMIERMPAPVVGVKDIVKTTNRVRVKERASGLSNRRTN